MATLRRSVAVPVALACAALLAWWLLSQGGTPEGTPRPIERDEARAEGAPGLVGHASPGGEDVDTEATPHAEVPITSTTQTVQATVLAEGTHRPLAGATVTVVAGAGRGLPVVLRQTVRARGTTDGAGHTVLTVARGTPRDVEVIARAPGHASARVPWNGEEAVTLHLPKGKTISGRVCDEEGLPVEGVTVRARAVDAPDLEDDLLDAAAGSAVRTTITGRHGRFELEGLWATPYALTAYGDGWRMPPETDGVPIEDREPTEAGATDVEIVVGPVRVFRLQILDEVLASPIPFAYHADVSFTIDEAPGIAFGDRSLDQHTARLFDGKAWVAVGSPEGNPFVFVSTVDLIPGVKAPTEAGVIVAVPGYVGVITTVRLLKPSELRTTATTDRITLKRAPERGLSIGRGHVVIQESPRDAVFWQPAWRELIVRDREDEQRTVALRGRRTGPHRWAFSGVPEGPVDIAVASGDVLSSYVEVEIEAGNTRTLRIDRPARTGILLEVRDERGAVVHRLDTLSIYPDGDQRAGYGAHTRWIRPVWDRARGRFLPRLLSCRPGRYTLIGAKAGHAEGSADVLVQANRVSKVKIVLGPAPTDR